MKIFDVKTRVWEARPTWIMRMFGLICCVSFIIFTWLLMILIWFQMCRFWKQVEDVYLHSKFFIRFLS